MNNVTCTAFPLKEKKFLIVHGYTASPEKNWFPWLKSELEALGAFVNVPTMPDSLAPNPERWQQRLQHLPFDIDENTILIGHSLGCVTALRFLQHAGQSVAGYVLVSGFDEEQPTLPELQPHTVEPLNYDELIKVANNRISIISTNDEIVSPGSSKALAEALKTQVIIEESAGHFLDREGYTEFKTLLDTIKTHFS
ncbi:MULTISPECIES: RBBP9/YdeN family alpha/beta hydrolase [Providencia]|uniref:Alpha/beta hydrolase n=2 Tax=Providencia TaxID=586 RepID=A0A264VU79_PRORE|nr:MULTISPECIES: alpha/beta hydrolase [Providencia]MRF67471.1 serine hydrolase family protein [Escherichia coli]MBJ9972060.1 serine hydrolase family protein [Providencia rettgeri]MBN6363769.1 serine hydrolase family protein [Providencia rettgeri]MBW3116606.1 alpha/beta hydrolase [Providencia rettgeri]MCF8962988.1 putative hydrolase YdeN [Providencia rettgeri]